MVELTASELERQNVRETVMTLDHDTMYRLDELMIEHGEGLTLYVNIDQWYDECDVTITLGRDRLETDGEYEKRIEKLTTYKTKLAEAAEKRRKTAQARKLKKTNEERELYERLKAKFEKE